jgi:hypothetical protein
MPSINQAAGGCGCGGCLRTYVVVGCNSLPLAGATVQFQRPAGTVIATGTTDAAGLVTLDILTAAAGTVVVTKSPRWSFTAADTPSGCPSSRPTITCTPATGYHCYTGDICLLKFLTEPLADTLHATDVLGNTWTLTWTAAGSGLPDRWTGTTTYLYPGDASCPSRNITLTLAFYGRDGSGFEASVSWAVDSLGCPGGVPAAGHSAAFGCGNNGDVTAPPAFSWEGFWGGAYPGSVGPDIYATGIGPPDPAQIITITE